MFNNIFPVRFSLSFLQIFLSKYFPKNLNLNGKVAVVTNASIGVGQKICMHLAQYGCNIVIVDSLPADETLGKLQQYDIKARAFQLDSSDEHEVLRLKVDVLKEFNTVDILVNNEAITSYRTIFEHTSEEIENMMEGRSRSVEYMTNAFLEVMKIKGQGFIMSISGTHGFSSYPYTPDFSYAKFKIMKFMTRLKILLKRQKLNGIKVMCLSPRMQTIVNEEFDATDFLTSEEYAMYVINGISSNCSLISNLAFSMIF